ncbi:peptidoglycan editing factor PgeF [Staphylococcus massiliensis]|uniref:Purine nucleoside phosphorylase n=1 Tax=Staphylococcus massiliensis S46 TaxID=1229783 RepID=K9B9J5_9STAP|nr:peptidoglycan editing factor PgeF [Staphylococcus massiliensis]EKU50385.1 hypothetical protein C273_00140 [Staphylococcus massiliensis S46]
MEKFKYHQHHVAYEDKCLNHVTIGMTTRQGGFSAYPKDSFNMARYIDDDRNNVSQHQDMLANEIQFDVENWVFPIQTHQNHIQEVTRAHRGINIRELTDDLHGIDGIYTYDQDVLLTMCYADCVPIYFYSEKHHYVGLAHAGWRGTVSQIVCNMIDAIDFNLDDLHVVIGPATSNSYEINADIKSQFEALPIDVNAYIDKRDEDRYGIDLKHANQLLCIYKGVPESNIDVTHLTTTEMRDDFFSYHLEKGQTGRMLAFIGQK